MSTLKQHSQSNRNLAGATSFLKLVGGIVLLCGLGWVAATAAGSFENTEQPTRLTHRITRGDLVVSVVEQGMLESAENLEIKSKVRGRNTVLWIIDSGTFVEKGDELVRLDSLFIQEQIDERTKYSNWSQSAADGSAARVSRSKLAVDEYQKGRYQTELMTLEKDVAIAEAAVRNSGERLRHVTVMASSGYISELEIEEREFSLKQAKLNLELKKTQLNVLKEFTFKEQMQTLTGGLTSVQATHKANVERAMADASRRDRAVEEIQYCVVKAPRSGLVIHPNAAKWETGPIAEGTNVHKNQVLLLMPDLEQMQVKVGVHESSVKRVKNGQKAKVTLAEGALAGTVTDVASITKPAGWWTGNQVRYDTVVSLPAEKGLRPGMSADVDITVAEYEDVVLIPVAAIVEQNDKTFCWVPTPSGPKRKQIQLGDSNDVFTIVEKGLDEDDDVFLNPGAYEKPIAETTDEEKQQPTDKKPKTKTP
ncbi:HlyD family efflux transporter periplasmic adaptor subunit [bacterium]|nr:HlyD family efflux transporter periplasmic adaptor subunit [bacterium]